MAKAAIENALWDAEARQKQMPLWKLLGGTRREIACGVSIGIQDSVEQLLEKIQTEVAAGYRRIKVKVKPGWDVNVLEKIRSRWPDIVLSCDANSAYTLDEVEHLRKFDQFNLLMIEQPLWNDDIYLPCALADANCGPRSVWMNPFDHARDAAFGHGNRRLPDHQHQSRARGRIHAKPRKFTTSARRAMFRCGAAACWSRASGGRTTSRSPRWKISACRAMCRPRSAIGRKTSSSRKSKFAAGDDRDSR